MPTRQYTRAHTYAYASPLHITSSVVKSSVHSGYYNEACVHSPSLAQLQLSAAQLGVKGSRKSRERVGERERQCEAERCVVSFSYK